MAVGLDDIQTELADLDIEVNIAYQYQKLWSVSVVKNYFCKFFLHAGIKLSKSVHWDPIISVKVTDEAVLSQLAQLCQRYGIDAEKISCEYFSFATNTKATVMGKLLRGRLL